MALPGCSLGHSFRVLAVDGVLYRRSFQPTVTKRRRFQRLWWVLSSALVLPNLQFGSINKREFATRIVVQRQEVMHRNGTCSLRIFFSGGNSCVPSVASDHRSSDKFGRTYERQILLNKGRRFLHLWFVKLIGLDMSEKHQNGRPTAKWKAKSRDRFGWAIGNRL